MVERRGGEEIELLWEATLMMRNIGVEGQRFVELVVTPSTFHTHDPGAHMNWYTWRFTAASLIPLPLA